MKKTLVKGNMIIDGTDAPPIKNGAVLINGNRILAVGKEEELNVDSDVEIMDCKDQTLLPGLIDCHNHLSLDSSLENYLYRMKDSLPELTLRACETMKRDLLAGVTTSRCIGDKEFLDVECKKKVNEGRIEGPSLVVATRGIRMTHGHGYMGYAIDGAEQIRKAVRENLLAGADFIKFYATGTVMKDGKLPCYISKQEIEVIVEETQRVETTTAVHCIGGKALRWCVEAGVNTIEHGYFVTEEDVELLANSDSWLVHTPSFFLNDERIQTLQPELQEIVRNQIKTAKECMSLTFKEGVKFAVGTDGMHGGLALEIAYLVDMGATERQALLAATAYAAEVCGLKDQIGTLEPGKKADIIGVEGDPLSDITVLSKVRTVISNGDTKLSS